LEFYDFRFYNQDTYDVEIEKNTIAEIYFRVEIDSIIHTRKVENIYTWLEAIGGIPELLKLVAQMIIGSYLSFHTTMMNIKTLYKMKTNKDVFH